MKLDQVLANQTEMLALMRKLTVASEAASEDVEDILPRPLQTAEELEESSRRLEEDGLLRKKTRHVSEQTKTPRLQRSRTP
ncbi:hypothetical protein LSAT2_021483 [Lamellibrachia satsuma]|nr:hypothetical protein LSAT2_021483 [Lamellibrachia satsuma]